MPVECHGHADHPMRAATGTVVEILIEFRLDQPLDAPRLTVPGRPRRGGRQITRQSDQCPAEFLFDVARQIQLDLLHEITHCVLLAVHADRLIERQSALGQDRQPLIRVTLAPFRAGLHHRPQSTTAGVGLQHVSGLKCPAVHAAAVQHILKCRLRWILRVRLAQEKAAEMPARRARSARHHGPPCSGDAAVSCSRVPHPIRLAGPWV